MSQEAQLQNVPFWERISEAFDAVEKNLANRPPGAGGVRGSKMLSFVNDFLYRI